MALIKVIPNVLIHEFLTGASLSGVAPVNVEYSFDYDNEASGPFVVGDALSWTGGTGLLADLVDNGTTGSMTIVLISGVVPTDGLTITGAPSGATCDVDGVVTLVGDCDSNETIKRGRYRRYCNLADGGLIDIEESVAINGFRVKDVLISAPGITAVIFYVVDRDSNAVCAGSATVTTGNGFNEWIEPGLLVAPGCKFKVVGTGTLTDAGRIMFILDNGWGASVFDFAPSIGRESRPPGMDRP
jgi:hypothetical protein